MTKGHLDEWQFIKYLEKLAYYVKKNVLRSAKIKMNYSTSQRRDYTTLCFFFLFILLSSPFK